MGDDEPDALRPLIGRLPVATLGGWRTMNTAVFGSGWPDRLGDRVGALADELPDEAGRQLHQTALVPPTDPRWGTGVEDRSELFARAGVFDGLRLQPAPAAGFGMSQGFRNLPDEPPADTPRAAWDDWRSAVRNEVVPEFVSWFSYELSGVQLLPAIHHLAELSAPGRKALSDLLLASLVHWEADWQSATITKVAGADWRTTIKSPLKYWLTTLPWLTDGSAVEPLRRRWLVPESLLRGQRERYAHLDPLSLELAHRLNAESELQRIVADLGLNVYPTENEWTGPELLDALAVAWTGDRVPAGRFDVFVGLVRHAWRHVDPDKGLPSTFLVRSGQRKLSPRAGSELEDVFLPDEGSRARSLQEYGIPTLEIGVHDAGRHRRCVTCRDEGQPGINARGAVSDRWRPVDRLGRRNPAARRNTIRRLARGHLAHSPGVRKVPLRQVRPHRSGVTRPTGFDVLAFLNVTISPWNSRTAIAWWLRASQPRNGCQVRS